jgi:hypothetical protein
MQHFSHEYLDKLIAEHRLVSATILKLTNTPMYARNHGSIVGEAVADLRVKKIQLEGMIDVLQEYLNG